MSMPEEEKPQCPLCVENLDATDLSFFPCKCGYQICLWCYHYVCQNGNARCPACRGPYNLADVKAPPLPEIFENAVEERKKQKWKDRENRTKNPPNPLTDRSTLQNVRVMQRNLIYVIGLSQAIAKEDVLKKKEYFGRFGRIVKVAVNTKHIHSDITGPSYSAYITFRKDKDASAAIQAMNGHMLDGRLIKATYGTTKYCSQFLRNAPCNNPQCLYLHELAKESDCFTKEDLTATVPQQPPHLFQQHSAVATAASGQDTPGEEVVGVLFLFAMCNACLLASPAGTNIRSITDMFPFRQWA